MGIIRVTIWVIGGINLLTRSPRPSTYGDTLGLEDEESFCWAADSPGLLLRNLIQVTINGYIW